MDAIKRYEFMRILKPHHLGFGLAVALIAGLLPGCTRYNPATGQSEVDYGATAGVAGAALGAAALGVALSNNNNGWNNGPVVVRGGVAATSMSTESTTSTSTVPSPSGGASVTATSIAGTR